MIPALEQKTVSELGDYTALTTAAAIHERPQSGLLALSDADRKDFLHRMTTNNINALQPGQSCVTVLTSPTARILFVFTVICRNDDLLLLPAAHQTQALERHLRGQIFFMDKVKVRNLSTPDLRPATSGSEDGGYTRLRLVGPQAGSLLASLGFDLAAAADGAWQEAQEIIAVRQERYDLPGYELIVPVERQPSLLESLQSAGAVLLAGDAAYQVRRIELGLPLPGAELTEEYNPLEAGLAWACADNKGCYTGQEIIARQITYDKITRSLVGLRSSQLLAPGTELLAEGRAVGRVTSSAHSPALDAPVALAIVKRPHHVAGAQLVAGTHPAEVVTLPFVS